MSHYPHTCPACGSPAYVGATRVECTNRACRYWDHQTPPPTPQPADMLGRFRNWTPFLECLPFHDVLGGALSHVAGSSLLDNFHIVSKNEDLGHRAEHLGRHFYNNVLFQGCGQVVGLRGLAGAHRDLRGVTISLAKLVGMRPIPHFVVAGTGIGQRFRSEAPGVWQTPRCVAIPALDSVPLFIAPSLDPREVFVGRWDDGTHTTGVAALYKRDGVQGFHNQPTHLTWTGGLACFDPQTLLHLTSIG